MPQLVVTSSEIKGQIFELTAEHITVGRLPDNVVCLPLHSVSSHHAELHRRENGMVLRDMNSTNGTRVNGQRIIETRLMPGDIIHFADVEAVYRDSVHASQPLPPVHKKLVDLSSTTVIPRPIIYENSSPFIKAQRKVQQTRKALQVALVLLGLLAVGLIGAAIILILNK